MTDKSSDGMSCMFRISVEDDVRWFAGKGPPRKALAAQQIQFGVRRIRTAQIASQNHPFI